LLEDVTSITHRCDAVHSGIKPGVAKKETMKDMEDFVTSRRAVLFLVSLFLVCPAATRNSHAAQSIEATHQTQITQLPPTYVPPGKQIYKEYCAACHGSDGKGRGPAASSLSRQPPDLTTLAKRHGGNFPGEYVKGVLRFGPGLSAHGAPEMPVWGPLFQYLENYNEAAVRQRIKNLSDFLESMQER
jgi:mono/diheme cytochrome c family protein